MTPQQLLERMFPSIPVSAITDSLVKSGGNLQLAMKSLLSGYTDRSGAFDYINRSGYSGPSDFSNRSNYINRSSYSGASGYSGSSGYNGQNIRYA